MAGNTTRDRSGSDESCDAEISQHVPHMRRGSSCQALRHAVLKLHRIDDFSMSEIGSGFFSQVYKVTHQSSGAVMVLKMNTSEDNRPNMLREVQLMNKMSHPNILKFQGVCVHRGQLHALTEYLNGGSLHEMLCKDKTTPILWNDRVRIAADVASGMEYLHSKNVFHRDLTSRNILIESTPTSEQSGSFKRAVVADFGLSTAIPDPYREFHLSVVGSPYWMAPECIMGQRYNETADIFSFGIVLCETIARIDADPDVLPRTQAFGLDYIAYSNLVDNCPLHFLYLAFMCCQMEPKKRPSFTEICASLDDIRKIQLELLDSNTNVASQLLESKTNVASQLLDSNTNVASQLTKNSHSAAHQFNMRQSLCNQRSCSDQSLDFLKTAECWYMPPTAKVIGKHMTKEDPLYQPAPANTNPFATNAQFSTGRKLVASEMELQYQFELSLTLPTSSRKQPTEINNNDDVERRGMRESRQSHSLPERTGIVQRAIAQFNSQISSSQRNRSVVVSPVDKLFSSGYASSDSSADATLNSHQFVQQSSKQRNLECAMLFCGLDLIQMHRASSSEWSDTNISSNDLESEFQDDLEDVLRQSQWSNEQAALSPVHDSVFSDWDSEWCASSELDDLSPCRYLHPTLVEKRKQLRRVESKQKEKLEQLQLKLEQLQLNARKSSQKNRKQFYSVS